MIRTNVYTMIGGRSSHLYLGYGLLCKMEMQNKMQNFAMDLRIVLHLASMKLDLLLMDQRVFSL